MTVIPEDDDVNYLNKNAYGIDLSSCGFPILDSWDDLPRLIKDLLAAPLDKADALQARLLGCYRNLKEHIQADIRNATLSLTREEACSVLL